MSGSSGVRVSVLWVCLHRRELGACCLFPLSGCSSVRSTYILLGWDPVVTHWRGVAVAGSGLLASTIQYDFTMCLHGVRKRSNRLANRYSSLT